METRKLSLVYAISGFMYTAVLFFIYLLIFGIYDLDAMFQSVKDYLPYLSVIIFFLSFVIGMISESILQKIVFWITKETLNAEFQTKIMMLKSEIVRSSLWYSYDRLLILRHFVVGPILLILFAMLWICSSDFVNKGELVSHIIVAGGFIIALAFMAYMIHKPRHKKLEDEVKKLINEQDR